MSEPPTPRFVDIAHLIFLQMIEDRLDAVGPQDVSRFLVNAATATAETFPSAEFASLKEFVAAIEDLGSPIARIEGRAEHLGDGLFGLGRCPFADTYRTHVRQRGSLSPALRAVQEEFNKPNAETARLSVGHGAAVCPFCCAHQPLRAALGARIKIGGQPMRLVQLACKSADGNRAFAEEFIARAGRTHAEIDAVLDRFVCCYAILA